MTVIKVPNEEPIIFSEHELIKKLAHDLVHESEIDDCLLWDDAYDLIKAFVDKYYLFLYASRFTISYNYDGTAKKFDNLPDDHPSAIWLRKVVYLLQMSPDFYNAIEEHFSKLLAFIEEEISDIHVADEIIYPNEDDMLTYVFKISSKDAWKVVYKNTVLEAEFLTEEDAKLYLTSLQLISE